MLLLPFFDFHICFISAQHSPELVFFPLSVLKRALLGGIPISGGAPNHCHNKSI